MTVPWTAMDTPPVPTDQRGCDRSADGDSGGRTTIFGAFIRTRHQAADSHRSMCPMA
jgi:hypothetical protein